jgi:hypothetical protein
MCNQVFNPSLTTAFFLAQLIQTNGNRLVLTLSLSLFSIGDLKLPSFSFLFPHQSLREKYPKLD